MEDGRKIKILFWVLAILIISFQSTYLSLYPTSIHAWAQGDLYALSKGYLNNGFNLFYPETFTYNKQYPYMWMWYHDSTITGGNLPLHQFIIAVFMKLFGTDSPIIYRAYVLFFSLLSLYYLLKITKLFDLNIWYSVFVAGFAVFSPVYLFYQANFLTTIPALSVVIIGLYYYFLFLRTEKLKHWNWAIVLIGISFLVRTTYAIPFVTVLCHQAFIFFQDRKFNIKQLIPVVIVCVLWWVQMNHFRYLAETYGSVFLMELLPAKSFDQLWNAIDTSLDRWKWEYFSKPQWLLYGVILLGGLFFIRKKQVLNFKGLGYFVLILLAGNILFVVFMVLQFPDHDYYFLDTVYLVVILSLIALLSNFPEVKQLRIVLPIAAVFFVIVFGQRAIRKVRYRHNIPHYDIISHNSAAYAGSQLFLKENGVVQDDKVAVLGYIGANVPFVHLNRRGYALDYTDKKVFESVLGWGIDYVVGPDYLLNGQIKEEYPYIFEYLTPVATNSKITLFKVEKSGQPYDIEGFRKEEK